MVLRSLQFFWPSLRRTPGTTPDIRFLFGCMFAPMACSPTNLCDCRDATLRKADAAAVCVDYPRTQSVEGTTVRLESSCRASLGLQERCRVSVIKTSTVGAGLGLKAIAPAWHTSVSSFCSAAAMCAGE